MKSPFEILRGGLGPCEVADDDGVEDNDDTTVVLVVTPFA